MNSEPAPSASTSSSDHRPETGDPTFVGSPKPRLTFYEKITLLVSLLALGTSAVALYFEFFDQREAVQLHVARLENVESGSLSLAATFINTGDFPITITRCTLIAARDRTFAPNRVVGALPPFILMPGEMRLEEIAATLVKPESIPDELFLGVDGQRTIGIRIEMLNHEGTKRVSRYPLIAMHLRPERYLFAFASTTFDLLKATEEHGAVTFTEEKFEFSMPR